MGAITATNAARAAATLQRGRNSRDFKAGVQDLLDGLSDTTVTAEEATRVAVSLICSTDKGPDYRMGAYALANAVGCDFDGEVWQRIARQFREIKGSSS